MRLTGLGPIRALVGEVAELVAFEALELAKVPRLHLDIFGINFAAGRIVVIIVREDDGAGGCA